MTLVHLSDATRYVVHVVQLLIAFGMAALAFGALLADKNK